MTSASLWRTVPNGPPQENAMPPCLAARILGYALVFAPSDNGRNKLAQEILGCNDEVDDNLDFKKLADLYISGLIRVFRNPKGPMPALSPSQSPLLAFKQDVDVTKYLLEKPSNNSQRLRTSVMRRDQHRCVFTGSLDWAQFGRDSTSSDERAETLELAHIISQSMSDHTGDGSEAATKKADWASTAGAMIERFGGFSLRDVLGEQNVQSPLNAFMASHHVHKLFDSLEVWLVPALTQDKDQELQVLPDIYDVESTVDRDLFHRIGQGLMSRVTFKAYVAEDETIPPPDPRILAVHAACAQIAHMSGAAEYMDEFFRDDDEISVKTQPGAGYKLTRALRKAKLVMTTV